MAARAGAQPLPTIVIVPAACLTPVFYEPLEKSLLAMGGFDTVVVPHPSCGVSPGLKDNSKDIAAVRQAVSDLVNGGKEVVVVMHSYGGIPGSAALEGLSKTARTQARQPGGIIRLIYVASFALKEGEYMPGANDFVGLRAILGENFNEEAGTLTLPPQAAIAGQFHDLPSEEAEHWAGLLRPHSIGALWSKQLYAAWRDIPSAYIVCELDRVVLNTTQEQMVREARELQPKAFDVVARLESGHQPILSRPRELGEMVRAAIGNEGW